MDFAFDEQQDLLRDSTRRFLEKRQSLDSIRPALESPELFDRAGWQEAASLGWTSMLVPEAYDGGSVSAQPIVDLVVLGEELGRVLHPGPFVATNVIADAIARSGSDDQRVRHLAAIAGGESIAAWCLTGDGSADPQECEVRATVTSDGYALNGTARFVHGAAAADMLLVVARADGGLVHALVPTTSSGVTLRAQRSMDLTRRFAEVSLDGVAVSTADVLPAPFDPTLDRAVDLATVLQSAEAVGAASYLFDQTVGYLKERTQFGRTIASFQAIKHRLADVLITVEAMRAATHYAALALNDGFPDATAAVSTAGSYVGDAFAEVCGEALQLHGGIGFTWEHDLHLYLRRAMTSRELYADPAWHRERLCTIAEAS